MASFDLADFWATLWGTGANPGCPSCGASNWGGDFPSFITTVPYLDTDTDELDYDRGTAAVVLVCQNCHFMRFHAIPQVEEVDPEGTNGASGRSKQPRSAQSRPIHVLAHGVHARVQGRRSLP
jgi:hypothetical protein